LANAAAGTVEPESVVVSVSGSGIPAALRAMVDGIDQPARLTGLDAPGDYCNEAATQPAHVGSPPPSDAHAHSAPARPDGRLGASLLAEASKILLTFEGRRYELLVANERGGAPPSSSLAVIADAEVDAAPSSPWARRWRLSPRHARVAACVIQGLSDKQIAQQLSLSVSTVRTYVRDLYARVGVHRRVGLVRASIDATAAEAESATPGTDDGARRRG